MNSGPDAEPIAPGLRRAGKFGRGAHAADTAAPARRDHPAGPGGGCGTGAGGTVQSGGGGEK